MRVNEEIEGIAVSGGEADEKQILNRIFDAVLQTHGVPPVHSLG